MNELDLAALENEFTAYALEQTSPLVRGWRGERLEADLRRVMPQVVSLLADEETASAFAETMNVLGLAASHFKAKLLEIDGHRFLAQIDFADTTGAKPFVAIFRGSQLPGAFEGRGIVDAIVDRFSVFAPVGIRFFHPSHVPMTLPGARVDQHFLASPVRDMLARPEAPGFSRIALAPPADLAFYPRYVEAYKRVYAARPHLRGEVRIETEETLGECLAQNLLLEITADGAWAGVVAARCEMLAGLDSVYMVEILLDQGARGQSLGPAVHQHFAKHVARTDPDAIISGTISPLNVPSLKTAQRAGRVEVGSWLWVDT